MVTHPCSTPALLSASHHPGEGAFSPGGLSSWISLWTCVLTHQTKPATTAMHKTRKQAVGKHTTQAWCQGRLRSSKVQTTHFKLKFFITAWRQGENMHQTEAFYYSIQHGVRRKTHIILKPFITAYSMVLGQNTHPAEAFYYSMAWGLGLGGGVCAEES